MFAVGANSSPRVVDEVVAVDVDKQVVETTAGSYDYDKIIVSTGVELAPEEVPGMMDGWQTKIFDFYTLDGAVNLEKALRNFRGGKLVLNIAEFPFKSLSPLITSSLLRLKVSENFIYT